MHLNYGECFENEITFEATVLSIPFGFTLILQKIKTSSCPRDSRHQILDHLNLSA